MNLPKPATLLITCGRGCLPSLQSELTTLGFTSQEVSPTSCETQGSFHDALKLLLHLRTANRILLEVASYAGDTVEDLYEAAIHTPWEEWIDLDTPFHIHGVAQMETLRDPRFAILRCKDAIADRFNKRLGHRPDAQSSPDGAACIAFYHKGENGRLFLDLAGAPLSRRGYRTRPWVAPLRETLAAAILHETAWNPAADEALAGPMCGSGTLAIEAALRAQNKAPGIDRPPAAFENLRLSPHDRDVWADLLAEAARAVIPNPHIWLCASDLHPQAVASAQENAARAGVAHLIHFYACDFRAAPLPVPPGVLVMNPEYGERMGDPEELVPHYRDIGDYLKSACTGLRAYVFTGSIALARQIKLKPYKRLEMYNGDLECRLLGYELYSGTRDPRLLKKHTPATE